MEDGFTEALRHLGHVYVPQPEVEIGGPLPVRHILKLYVPTGDVAAFCGSTDLQGLGCPALWPDSNCEQCREAQGLGPSLTKRSLMVDLVNVVCNVEQMFLDAMYWNFHNQIETPINPDPEGELAKAWIESRTQLVSMMARFEPTMQKHEGRFGWPMDFPLPKTTTTEEN